MKRIDVTNMVILCSGEEWRFEVSPCSKDAINLLERNERVVTWLMPVAGTIKDQIASIRFKDGYYSLSLRMMKAIYRHVRLYKDFVNIENVNGIQKQRIPELLLREKIRTQSRFDVCDVAPLHQSYYISILPRCSLFDLFFVCVCERVCVCAGHAKAFMRRLSAQKAGNKRGVHSSV